MAPDTMDDKTEDLQPHDDANRNRSNEQWKLLMETQNAQLMELIRMINEPHPQANISGEYQPALTITLPEFNPEVEGADALAWCNLVDICLGEYPLQGSALIIALSNSLKGSASSWLPQVTYEGMTWAEFKVNFLACYDSQNTCAATMIGINNSHPKEDESYAAYASRLVNSFLTRWKDLTSEQIAVSFVLAHISRFDNRVQRMAHTTEILTRGKLVQELAGFSHLKHKLQPNLDGIIDLTPEKRFKNNVPIHHPARKRKSTKVKKATATPVGMMPEIIYNIQPNTDENVLKVKLVKSTEPIQRPPKKRKSTKPKTASSKPMHVMPDMEEPGPSGAITASEPGPSSAFNASEPGPSGALTASEPGPSSAVTASESGASSAFTASEQGPRSVFTASEPGPSTAITASEPGPSSAFTARSHVDTSKYGCVCCGPPVTRTLPMSETNHHTVLRADSRSETMNTTIYVEIDIETKNHNEDQSNGEDTTHTVSRLESSPVDLNKTIYIDCIDTEENQNLNQTNEHNKETVKHAEDVNQNVIQTNIGNGTNDVYAELVLLEQCALVPNAEEIECGVCMDNYQPGQGAVLRECVHTFCKECLADVVKHSEEPAVSCPAMGCPGLLQQREIRALVSPEEYERWLAKGLAAAESGARNSFHCQTADCKGWAMCDPGVTRFLCPVCSIINCVTCQAIHEDDTCEEYRAKKKSDEKTKTYLDQLLSRGDAMQCPECNVIISKQFGCDWIKCTACKTEICWATRGRRWGPRGRGDTSGGCRCRVNRKKCHPSCRDCH